MHLLKYADREKTMPRFGLVPLVLAALCAGSLAAHARVCIRDLTGQIVCGEPVETRDEPGEQATSRPDDSRDPGHDQPDRPDSGPEPRPQPGALAPQRYGTRNPGSLDAPNFTGNVVRPVRGMNGQISCSNPNYTWQDGACKPYRGSRRGW
jgi:hypothetical protein